MARSDIHALTTLGVPEMRAVGPKTLVPGDLEQMGVRVCHDMDEGIKGCDVIIMLRLQNERMSGALLPSAPASSSRPTASRPRSSRSPSPTRS